MDYSDHIPSVEELLTALLSCCDTDSQSLVDNHAQSLVDTIYSMIVHMLQQATQQTIPTIQVDAMKYWWDQELDILKEEAIQTDKI